MEKHVYKRTIYLLTILIWLAIPFDTLATFRYVKPTATGTGTGLSWADASADLQGMINLSVNGDEVWVMAGTYFPTRDGSGNASPADPRTRTFLIRSGVKVYGSFAGTETSTADRVNIWTTILSGNLGTLSNANDNAYRVVSFANQSDANLLDNFSIRNGYDNQSSSPSGGGIYFNDETSTYSPATSPVINQCELAFNQNGGLYVGSYNLPTITGCSFSFNTEGAVRNQPFSQPTFSDCTFYSNTTSTEGGAVSNIGCMPLFKTCKFLGNSTQSSRTDIYSTGGAMFNKGSDVVLRSCLFDGNTALYAGGAISCVALGGISKLTAINCTFVHNQAPDGAAITHTVPGSPSGDFSLTSCIFWDNSTSSGIPVIHAIVAPTITYSDVQGCSAIAGCAGETGNISVDPQFDSDVAHPYRLTVNSPLINAGDPFADFITPFQVDLHGLPRLVGSRIDIGCAEQQMTDAIFSIADGAWNDPATWACGCVPTVNDVVRIRTTVSIPVAYTASARTILYSAGGRLTAGSETRLRLGVRIRYVRQVPAGAADGSSWANASGDLRATLMAAQTGEEVWVAQGIYKPTTGTNRTLSFAVPSGVKVYGGFSGTESTLDQRNRNLTFPLSTTLSGGIGTTDPVDNTYHVVTFQNAALGTVLDGFVISDGGTTTNTESPVPPGGYTGGGIYNESTAGQSSSPTIQNCHVTNNRGAFYGGGMYNSGTGLVSLRNCLFNLNYGEYGGAVANSHVRASGTDVSSITLIVTNCDLVNNSCLQDGKAIYGGHLLITNTIVWANGSGSRPLVFAGFSDPSRISYSIVQDGAGSSIYDGSTVTDANPMFVANLNYQLKPNSPAINSGDPAASTYNEVDLFDLGGNYRIFLGRVDRGCFEYLSFSY